MNKHKSQVRKDERRRKEGGRIMAIDWYLSKRCLTEKQEWEISGLDREEWYSGIREQFMESPVIYEAYS